MKSGGMKIIGLTGGIGSGKSTVSAYFSDNGHVVIDADRIAREIVAPGMPVLSELASAFGEHILNSDGTLDRKKLAEVAFGDKILKKRMDAIMHGEILRIIDERIAGLAESGYNSFVLLDIPLLFETNTGLNDAIDEIWVVDAEDETRIERVIGRDGISRQDIIKIMDSQMSREEKRKRADVVIENSGSKEELYRKIDKLVKRYERA